ncbi:RecX family transcriptional regulator [Paenibacillus darwinianus]|uniref:Regulatory protein RecX n=1 Tax=Paenibacillus darwinianus TaxID=1380763 RepID=A0A9W5S3E4_9BACL|nr:RecX family transcriptional regulator [Paenibacillus darwinianus]EXX91148.1 RecX family transcriptional regulator [Paenibacillus darwinianus]EXX92051.1 RecX family transcriptional regulator [Paenibacillus darwinianus]EXX92767.1 RecX family transcriptional regulator [Paenibacillus darwinianus]
MLSGPGEEALAGAFRISSVEKVRKQRGRYFIYREGQEEPVLSVHEDMLIRFRLLKDAWVTEEDLRLIETEDGRHRAYSQAIAYLGAKPRTRKEIERYLARKELDEETIRETADRLESERLIDDADYAKIFTSQRAGSHAKGRMLIRQELIQRGIGKSEAAEAIEAIDPDMEREAAIKAAVKRWPSLKGELRERRRKLAQFLTRRGYPSGVVREALKTVATSQEDNDGLDWLDN